LGIKQKLQLDWLWLKLSYPFRWAHHPTCYPYSNQRFDITLFGRKLHLCQGCTLVTFGALLSFLIFGGLILIGVLHSLYLLLTVILAPEILVVIIDSRDPPRWLKRVARIILGHSTGTALAMLVFFPGWGVKLFVVICLLLARAAYKWFRTRSPSKDLCPDCEFFPEVPYCPGLTQQMEANKRYKELALPVLETSIRRQVEQKYQPPVELDHTPGKGEIEDTSTRSFDII